MTTTTKKPPITLSSAEAQEAFEEGKPVMNSLGEIYKLCLASGSISASFADAPKKVHPVDKKPNFGLYPSDWVIVEE